MNESAASGAPADGPPAPSSTTRDHPAAGGRSAGLVAAGILLSRIFGLVRQRVFGHFLGAGDAAGAFTTAFRIPNILQNLFGEGVLSASFIPVYAGLRARGEDEARRTLAESILGLLLLTTAVLVLLGIAGAPLIVTLIVPKWTGAQRDLTILLVRVLFPGAALFVLSAWSLGILNSHGRFFLSYASGVFWNLAMIGTLLIAGGRTGESGLVVALAWGSVIGALLQFAVQLPSARRALGHFSPRRLAASPHARTVLRNFGPVFVGRGVSQISGLTDTFLSGLISPAAAAILGYAQAIYMLPVSLFGMSVSAAELPAMSSVVGHEAEIAAALRARLQAGLGRIAFFVVPSAVGFLVLGDQVAALVYRGGKFGSAEAVWVWAVLAGSAVGLLASTLGRLYSSAFYALRDTRTPLRFSLARVICAVALGAFLSLLAPRLLGIDAKWGVAGITVGSGIAGWVEFILLRRALRQRIGDASPAWRAVGILWLGAGISAAAAAAVEWLTRALPVFPRAALVLLAFSGVYGACALAFRVPEADGFRRRLFRSAD